VSCHSRAGENPQAPRVSWTPCEWSEKLVTPGRAAAFYCGEPLVRRVPRNRCGVLAAWYNPGGAPIRESRWRQMHATEKE
jgi:hypothetical protein